MSVVKRVSDIVSANFSELIERYEDPELLLKQAVREMEESIRAALENAAKVVGHEKILARQLKEEEEATKAWQRRAAAAVQRNDENAARLALRQKRQHEVASRSVAGQLAEVAAAGQSLRGQIEAMRRRIDEAQRKLVLLAARQRAAEARQQLLRQVGNAPFGDAAFHKFDRMCQRIERLEAEADALSELSCDSTVRSEVGQPHDEPSDNDLEAELRALRAQIQVATG